MFSFLTSIYTVEPGQRQSDYIRQKALQTVKNQLQVSEVFTWFLDVIVRANIQSAFWVTAALMGFLPIGPDSVKTAYHSLTLRQMKTTQNYCCLLVSLKPIERSFTFKAPDQWH